MLPIVHVPFTRDNVIDEASLRRQLDWAFEVGADGCGTGMVSEILRLTTKERLQLAHLIPEIVAGRGPIFASVGAESTAQAVTWAKEAEVASNDALMAIPPTLTALPNAALINYFTALAEATELPLIVQDASAYVGQAIPLNIPTTLLERFGPDKILFKPEADPLGPNLSALRDATGGKARIFEGSGGIVLVDSYRRGIAGTMPGMDLLDGIVTLWQALQDGDEDRAYEVYYPICALIAMQMQAGLDGFLAIEKHLLVKRGLFENTRRRRPYKWEPDEETLAEVDRLFAHLQAIL
ncbi:MAG: dihydrodipicolinate synthase family protein [Opitutales bacterium]